MDYLEIDMALKRFIGQRVIPTKKENGVPVFDDFVRLGNGKRVLFSFALAHEGFNTISRQDLDSVSVWSIEGTEEVPVSMFRKSYGTRDIYYVAHELVKLFGVEVEPVKGEDNIYRTCREISVSGRKAIVYYSWEKEHLTYRLEFPYIDEIIFENGDVIDGEDDKLFNLIVGACHDAIADFFEIDNLENNFSEVFAYIDTKVDREPVPLTLALELNDLKDNSAVDAINNGDYQIYL